MSWPKSAARSENRAPLPDHYLAFFPEPPLSTAPMFVPPFWERKGTTPRFNPPNFFGSFFEVFFRAPTPPQHPPPDPKTKNQTSTDPCPEPNIPPSNPTTPPSKRPSSPKRPQRYNHFLFRQYPNQTFFQKFYSAKSTFAKLRVLIRFF
jgi:hypothetical protein